MNPDNNQFLFGMAYKAKLQEDLQSNVPFAEFDNLTPEEPGRTQQFLWHCLKVAAACLSQTRSNISRTDVQPRDGQTVTSLK